MAGYFSRDDEDSLEILNDLHRTGIFFVEERSTQRWVEAGLTTITGDWMTKDPHRAMRFENKFQAMTYMVKGNLKYPEWYVTEHEFC